MEEFFDNFPISRERVERGRTVINTRNAGHTEELEKYKNTLEKQWRRESSFLLFKQKKFLSRQEKVLGKTFHLAKTQLNDKKMELPRLKACCEETSSPHTAERKMSDSKLSTIIPLETKKKIRRVLSARETRNAHFNRQFKEKKIEATVVHNGQRSGTSSRQKDQQQECDAGKQTHVKVIAFEKVKTEQKQRIENEIRETAVKCSDSEEVELQQVQTFLTENTDNPNESRLHTERIHVQRKSLSLPEIACPSNFEDSQKFHESASKQELGKPKKSRSKQKHKIRKRKSRDIVTSSSLPDVRPKPLDKFEPLKSANKSKLNNLTLPRVKRSSHEVKPKGNVNLSVACRVIRIKNTFTKGKRSKKGHDKNVVKKDEEITPELWETLKNCRYLRISNKTTEMTCG